LKRENPAKHRETRLGGGSHSAEEWMRRDGCGREKLRPGGDIQARTQVPATPWGKVTQEGNCRRSAISEGGFWVHLWEHGGNSWLKGATDHRNPEAGADGVNLGSHNKRPTRLETRSHEKKEGGNSHVAVGKRSVKAKAQGKGTRVQEEGQREPNWKLARGGDHIKKKTHRRREKNMGGMGEVKRGSRAA